MSVKTVAASVAAFLAHHVDDLYSVAGALSALVNAVPIDPQDKNGITDAISTVKSSVDNINSFLSGATVVPDGGTVEVKESDLVNALGDFFNSDAGKVALENATRPTVPTGAATNG